MKTYGLIATTAFLLSVGAVPAWGQKGCQPMTPQAFQKLLNYVQKKFRVADTIPLNLEDRGFVRGTCYRKLEFVSENPARPFHLSLVASPDLRLLARDVMDSEVDPSIEDRDRQQAASAAVTKGSPASLGPRDAPVVVAVFSDFQCPYCSTLAATLTKELQPQMKNQVRLVYRYFPLPMHPWAKPAAEAAACAQRQGDAYFWRVHDYLFAHQRELNPDNLRSNLMGEAGKMGGFKTAQFKLCLDQKSTAAQVQDDIGVGTKLGVHGTPTVFVNGEQAMGSKPDQLRSLIQQKAKLAAVKVSSH